ncbi:glucuronate isomerase [Cohnella thailandensis]|uniref:Uronate isomerase n=1 Tax=Cohnella thailandensis TaxID=557557 RepID=A0A841T1P6_9BACL|nr:glucuronate isomerase [Cohnella thailandensis]MBB6636000.1 glucuronate isomerase [Cohnella thailandensis]MBP1976378.1 glucuronate isomerase [Cohnella thailandensis]
MIAFSTENLLLTNKSARILYRDYAAEMPIYDYHSHLDPRRIASGQPFRNLTELWLNGDHYKWRALRWLGVDEAYITGSASDKDKFLAWAKAAPAMAGNPLYHWTHLELSRYFGIGDRLSESNAEEIWNRANERLQEPDFGGSGILEKFKVRVVCTTDDPIDSLEDHASIKANPSIRARVAPTFRPDRILDIRREDYRDYIAKLGEAADVAITGLADLLTAIGTRIDFFHANGCRLSDHGFGELPYTPVPESEIARILKRALDGGSVTEAEAAEFQTYMLLRLGEQYHARGWTMQLHIGAIRNNNDRMSSLLGKDSGYDSILDYQLARSLNGVLNALDQADRLPKTIVYSLYPYHYEMIATTIGNFQGGGHRGKLQLGSAWWFHDQKEGMIQQLKALSSIGLISTFVGMLTDSRSFMSFPRHEYFRRVLCGLFGTWMEDGELPMDYEYIGEMIRDICYRNAESYFGI